MTVARIPAAFVLLCLCTAGHCASSDEEWIQLFNGRDLTGWTPKLTHHGLGENYANTFRVENGSIRVSYDGYEAFGGRFGHLFYDKPFSHYRLAIEYRFIGEQAPQGPGSWAVRNSGVMLHSQDPRTMKRDQDFPISIEAQFLGGLGDGKARPTLNVCTPGTEVVHDGVMLATHCLNSASATFDGDQWVRAEIIVLGSERVTHTIGGETVLEYTQPRYGGGAVNEFEPAAKPDGEPIEGGYLALQSESHPIEFRKVELLNLAGCMDRKAANYRRYYVKSVPAQCLYHVK